MANNDKNRSRDEQREPGRIERLKNWVLRLVHFLSYDIWRLNPEAISNKKNILFNAIKTVMLTVRNVQELNIAASARSLTYRTLLSIVPLLAVIFAIARGFGIENIMQTSIFNLMTGEAPGMKPPPWHLRQWIRSLWRQVTSKRAIRWHRQGDRHPGRD